MLTLGSNHIKGEMKAIYSLNKLRKKVGQFPTPDLPMCANSCQWIQQKNLFVVLYPDFSLQQL